MKFIRIALIAAALLLPSIASAQSTLNATYDVGRVWDAPNAEFSLFHLVGAEIETPSGVDLSVKWHISAFTGEVERTSLLAHYEAQGKQRIRFILDVEHITYHVDYFEKISGLQRYQDWRVIGGAKIRLKEF